MNEEVAKIRELRNEPQAMPQLLAIKNKDLVDFFENNELDEEVGRLDIDMMSAYIKALNMNNNELFIQINRKKFDERVVYEAIIKNIYLILEMFNEMCVYPGYFVEKVYEMHKKYWEDIRKKELKHLGGKIKKSYHLTREMYELQKKYWEGTRKVEAKRPGGSNKKTYHLNYEINSEYDTYVWQLEREVREGYDAMLIGSISGVLYPKSSVSDLSLEITAMFEAYRVQYRVKTKEELSNVFNYFYNNCTNLMERLSISGLKRFDIQYLSQLLYEYIAFLVVLGKNPKAELDQYIEEQAPKGLIIYQGEGQEEKQHGK